MSTDTQWKVTVSIDGPGFSAESSHAFDSLPANTVPPLEVLEDAAAVAVGGIHRSLTNTSDAMRSISKINLPRPRGEQP